MDSLDKNKYWTILEKTGWHELLCKTNFSFLMGSSHPQECLDQAKNLNYQALAINDFDGVYGLARSHIYKTQNKLPLKLIHGAEIHLLPDHDLSLLKQETVCLLAQSKRGYKNLCQIISYAHRATKTKSFITLEDLLHTEIDDIIAIKPTRGGIRTQSHAEYFNVCKKLKEKFSNNFYMTITKLFHPEEDIFNPKILELSHTLGIPLIFSQDIFFHSRSEKRLSDLVQTIRTNLTLREAVGYFFPNTERSFHTLKELAKIYGPFENFEIILKRMKDISDSCQFDMSELKYHYPQEFLPAGKTAFQYLTELTWQKAHERYDNIPDKVQTLIMHELELIQNLNFADYFLTVWDIVRWAREQKILCQGRGSAANSAICYVLGVTNVDPSEFDVLFERFISIERGDPPDIDVDFEHERREEVIQYVYQRYGRNKAAMVANVICFKKKGAVRAVGKALGVPEIILDEAAKYLSMRQYRRSATQKTISEASDKIFLSENLQNIWREYSEKLLGFPRHLGIHSGGFLLSNDPIDELVPREPATMPGRTCLQWCKDDIEGLGFFKIDLLALGMLTAIRKIFHTLKIHYGQDLAMQTVPPNDSKTYNMIQKADTVGVFQIESRAQMQMLPRLRPEKFYDLVIEIAIIRPGPIQGKMIHPYLKRRRGLEPEEYPHEKLIPILKRTLGIPIFQEQVMRIAMAVGDFTAGESNELRKNIGTFSMRGDVEKWIPKLITGMRRNGIKEDFIKHLIGQLHGFSAYGFPESHSVSFAHLAYISCYLKAHFPPAFYIGIMNSQPMGFYSIHVLLRTAKLEGINIRPICVLHSQWDSTIEKDPDSTHGFAIRLGLRLVTSLSASGAKAYLARRQHYSSLHDFLTQCQLSRVDLTALAAANALQIFNIKRRTALWLSEAAPYSSFFLNANEPVPFFSELSAAENVQLDFISQKTTLGEHPTEIIKKEAWAYKIDVAKITLAKNLKVSPPSLVHVFGMVLVRQSPPTAKGMVFITMEDETGMINLVFDPKTYDKYQKLIDFKGIIFAQGVLQNESGSISIFVKQVHSPEEKLAEVFKLEILEQEEFSAIRNYM